MLEVGQQYQGNLALVLVDHDRKPMVLDNASQISIKIKSNSQSILGTNVRKVTKGVAVFDDFNIHFSAW